MPGSWPLPWVVATLVPAPLSPRVQVLLEALPPPPPPSAAGAPALLWFSLTLAAASPLGLRRLPPVVIWVPEAVALSSSPKVPGAALQLVQVLAVPVLALQPALLLLLLTVLVLVLASPPQWAQPGRAPSSPSSS